MALSLEEIRHLADLARIELDEEEQEKFRGQIEAILGYIHRLAEIDTSSIVLDGQADPGRTLAADIPAPVSAGTRAALVQAFPDRLGEFLRVPGVFDRPKS